MSQLALPHQHQDIQASRPLYDLFLDVPHPAASRHCPPAISIGAPNDHDSIEEELSKTLPQISRFAFPEYDEEVVSTPLSFTERSPINIFDQYAMQPAAFQNYTFSLTLQSGMRVHGHVRRHLPCHLGARSRYDVGRRGERALVILTRVTGADETYAAILKTVDAIRSHQFATPAYSLDHPVRAFLGDLFGRHQTLARHYVSNPTKTGTKPVFLSIQNLEVGADGSKKFSLVDTIHFLLTPPLLARTSVGDVVSTTSNSSILPLLRCLGVAHTLRLLCALLSERRVILISASPTRLATCCKAAIAILAQGLLHWHHLYIPVLPPHLWQYLAAPYPYLIGILASLASKLDHTDGLGEVLLINLDRNSMETRGIAAEMIQERIPDLLRNITSDPYSMQMSGASAAASTAPEVLAQDLVELLKNDKKILYGESALASMQDTAVKATKAVRNTLFKLKEKSKRYFKSDSYGESDSGKVEEQAPEVNSMSPDCIYIEGCRNELAEEEVRIAFCAFFLCMVGNMRWYLSAHPGQPPQLDRKRYLQQKRAVGESDYSPLWPLLQNFCHTQMLEEFAKLRVDEIRLRKPVTNDSPLFLQCANYHQQHKVDFGLLSARRVVRQVAQTNPSRMLQLTNARRTAMELTSKRPFEGDYNKTLADLVEQCRESSSVLFDVMSVVWIRMRDNVGMQWRHATNSLHILKNLLFHGPLAAVAEATDGLAKIRALKYYSGNRQTSVCLQIRSAATQVYSLVVDRSKLYCIRRVCVSKRMSLKKQDRSKFTRDGRLCGAISVPFQKVHAAMRPGAPRSVAPRTPVGRVSAAFCNATPTFAVLPPAQNEGQDLLGLQQPVKTKSVSAPTATANADIFGMFTSSNKQQIHASGSAGLPGQYVELSTSTSTTKLQRQNLHPASHQGVRMTKPLDLSAQSQPAQQFGAHNGFPTPSQASSDVFSPAFTQPQPPPTKFSSLLSPASPYQGHSPPWPQPQQRADSPANNMPVFELDAAVAQETRSRSCEGRAP